MAYVISSRHTRGFVEHGFVPGKVKKIIEILISDKNKKTIIVFVTSLAYFFLSGDAA